MRTPMDMRGRDGLRSHVSWSVSVRETTGEVVAQSAPDSSALELGRAMRRGC